MTEPYAGYDGLVYAETYGPSAFHMRARTEGLRDFGACLSPQNAFYILQGVETLPLRIERHIANTHEVVKFLATHRGGRLGAASLAREPRRLSSRAARAAQGRGLDGELRRQGRTLPPAGASSRPASSPRTSPTSATPRRW